MEIREIVAGTLLLDWVLLVFFLLAFLVQLGIYVFVFLKFPRYRKQKTSTSMPEISVIICAKNEELNLKAFLPHILQQDYPEFEVVVVNDSSTDDSEELLMQLSAEYRQLRYTSIPSNEQQTRGKKLALTIGLKSARYNHVILTDADCYPVSDHWLRSMASNFSGNTKIVLGYGGYERQKGILNKLIRYETTFTAMQYFAYAIKGHPYMGVGRNLAYTKALFFENKGFSGHYQLLSGDDDLFVNANASGINCAVEFSPESHTLSLPEATLASWIRQKKRHITSGSLYRKGSKVRLASELISRILFYTTLIWICISSPWIWPVAVLSALLLSVRLLIFKMGMQRLDEKYLLLPSLLFDPVLPVILGLIWLSSRFEKKYTSWR